MELLSFFDAAYRNREVYMKNKELLKEIILVCAFDFLKEKRHISVRFADNIFFHRKKELLLILQTDMEIFFYIYEHINSLDDNVAKILGKYDFMKKYLEYEFDNSYAPKNISSNTIAQMRQDGATLASGVFSNDEISEISYYYNQKLSDKTHNVGELYDLDGRQRSYWSNPDSAPAAIRRLFHNDFISDMASSYFGVETKCSMILAERMTTPEYVMSAGLQWHVDNLSDQLKVMIPLSNIGVDNAPMEYMPTSQDSSGYSDALAARIYHIFQMASIKTASDCLVEDRFADGLDYSRQKACCSVGDAVFFDTRLMHRGGVCNNGAARENLVLIFNGVPTRRNRLFRYLYDL